MWQQKQSAVLIHLTSFVLCCHAETVIDSFVAEYRACTHTHKYTDIQAYMQSHIIEPQQRLDVRDEYREGGNRS